MIYEQHKIKIHFIIFGITIIAFIFSPPYNRGMAFSEGEDQTTRGVETGMDKTVSNTGKVDSKAKGTGENGRIKERTLIREESNSASETTCNANCKINTLTGIGIDAQLAKPLVENCKRLATDPRHCIIAGASIIMAESGGKLKNCYKFNCMGYGVSRFRYTSYEVQIIDWINSYTKYWYKAKSASFFYPPKGQVSKSRYCTSEDSTGSSVGCPAGLGHASKTWNTLSKKF